MNNPNALSGLQFGIDEYLTPLPLPPTATAPLTVTYPLTTGYHELTWVYHQEGGPGLATLKNLIIVGLHNGQGTLSQPYPCPGGTFSTDPKATSCTECPAGSYSTPGSTACTLCPINTYSTNSGSATCTPCGQGSTTANAIGSTYCTTTCVFDIAGKLFNLTTLGNFSIYTSATGINRNFFELDVCSTLGNDLSFPRTCVGNHICQVYFDGVKLDVGRSFRVVPNNVSSDTPFSIYFEHGQTSLCSNSSGATTIINFACNPTSGASAPIFVQQSADYCTYQFYWQHYAACPVCTTNDYTTVLGTCSGSRRQVSSTRVNNCNGAFSLPSPTQSCSSTEFPTGGVVATVVVFAAVVSGAGVVVWRNRVMARRYATLMEDSRSSNVKL